MNAHMTFFNDALKLMTAYVSHGNLNMKSFAETLILLFKLRLPVFCVSILVLHNRTQYRIASSCPDSAFALPDEFQIDDELMTRLNRDSEQCDMEQARLVEPAKGGALFEAFQKLYGPDMSSIFIPLGFFPHFTEFTYISIGNKGMPYTRRHVAYCNAIRELLVFGMAVILKQEPLVFENGRLTRVRTLHFTGQPRDGSQTLDEHIIECIRSSLRASHGRVAGKNGAAAMLGLNASTLWSKIRKYRIEMPKKSKKPHAQDRKNI